MSETQQPVADVGYSCGCSRSYCPTHRPPYLPAGVDLYDGKPSPPPAGVPQPSRYMSPEALQEQADSLDVGPSGTEPATELVNEAQRLLHGITPGEWRVDDDDIKSDVEDTHVVCFGHDYDEYGDIGARHSLMGAEGGQEYSPAWYAPHTREQEANRAFIAAAPRLVRQLLAALAALAALQEAPSLHTEIEQLLDTANARYLDLAREEAGNAYEAHAHRAAAHAIRMLKDDLDQALSRLPRDTETP